MSRGAGIAAAIGSGSGRAVPTWAIAGTARTVAAAIRKTRICGLRTIWRRRLYTDGRLRVTPGRCMSRRDEDRDLHPALWRHQGRFHDQPRQDDRPQPVRAGAGGIRDRAVLHLLV